MLVYNKLHETTLFLFTFYFIKTVMHMFGCLNNVIVVGMKL